MLGETAKKCPSSFSIDVQQGWLKINVALAITILAVSPKSTARLLSKFLQRKERKMLNPSGTKIMLLATPPLIRKFKNIVLSIRSKNFVSLPLIEVLI